MNAIDKALFHDRYFFLENYKEMNRSLNIYIYSHRQDDPFANVLLPVDFEPTGNHASESYYKKALVGSYFITKDPSIADLFFLPFSIARLRHDPRVGIMESKTLSEIIFSTLVMSTPIGIIVEALIILMLPVIQLVILPWRKLSQLSLMLSKLYALQAIISLPMLLIKMHHRHKFGQTRRSSKSGTWKVKAGLFFAGSINSPVREKILQVWENDSEIAIQFGRLPTPYSDELLGSKFCLHVKGFEVNTARIGDALCYGCVPVIIAYHYDLPFQDILNWKSFSIFVVMLDIPPLKKILEAVCVEEYLILRNNLLKVRKHFKWNLSPVDYDTLYLVMYELWLRRSSLRLNLNFL